MQSFLSRHAPVVTSTLSGFDRLVFRGTLIQLVRPRGMYSFLCRAGIRLLDFKKYVEATSNRVKEACLREAIRLERPIRYLASSLTSKEDLARTLLAEHPIESGLICAFRTIEPCMSFEYHLSQDPRERGLRLRQRKCLHIYKYYLHRMLGFIGVRLQTWFPFSIQVTVNGREWLSVDLRKRRQKVDRHDNCFLSLGNPELAQRLMDRQLRTDWPAVLNRIARAANPLHERIFETWPQDYYWSAYQTEWATDVVFRDPEALAGIYPSLVRHAMHHFRSPDVMRFLERKVHGRFEGELTSSFKDRPEGVRVKHWVHGNSVKMYDKAERVLRIETTIGNPQDFKVPRSPDAAPTGCRSFRPMRKGTSDLIARARLSQRANERYLDALAAVHDPTPTSTILDAVSGPAMHHGRRYRALKLGSPDDLALLQVIVKGEYTASGFRNRDLLRELFPATSTADHRRVAARIGRQVRLLRAHGLVRKVPKSHRYLVTRDGHRLATAIAAIRNAPVEALAALAA
jgi:hypothetical protein